MLSLHYSKYDDCDHITDECDCQYTMLSFNNGILEIDDEDEDENIDNNKITKVTLYEMDKYRLPEMLPLNIFDKYNNITSINISEVSGLKYLQENIFNSLTELKIFTMVYTDIVKLPGELFKNNKKLEEITIHHYNFTTFEKDLLKGLINLKKLMIGAYKDDEKKSYLPEHFLDDNINLEYFEIRARRIYIPTDILKYNDKLKRIIIK